MQITKLLANEMRAQEVALQYKSLNMVNLITPGYKRVSPAFSEAASHLDSATADVTHPEGSEVEPGPFVGTGRSLDVFLQPNQYLVVQDETGQVAYSRFGRLTVSADGELLDGQGLAVQLQGVTERLSEGSFKIGATGKLIGLDGDLGSLGVVSIQNASMNLDGYVRNPVDVGVADEGVPVLQGGGYEGSNVVYIDEMVGLLRQIRLMGGLQSAYKSIDALDEKSLSVLGRF